MVGGILRDLEVHRHAGQVRMRPQECQHRVVAGRYGAHGTDEDLHHGDHGDDRWVAARLDELPQDVASCQVRLVGRVEERREHGRAERKAIALGDRPEQR